MVLKNSLVRLDKVVIGGFLVNDVEDISELITNGEITVKQGAKHYITMSTGEFFSCISIGKNDCFDSFIYSINNDGKIYGSLELSVDYDGYHNLNGFSAEKYRKKIDEVKEYLLKHYGITVCFENAKYKRLEIQRTIAIDGLFESYQRVLNLIIHNIAGRSRMNNERNWCGKSNVFDRISYKKNIQTYLKSSGERGRTVKIYNKSKQLRDVYGIVTDVQYLRFEISLLSSKAIKDSLKTNDIWLLQDDVIEEYFNRFISAYIESAFSKHCTYRDRTIKRILKDNYSVASRTWVRDSLEQIANNELQNGGVPILLDIEELYPLLDNIKWSSRQAKYNAKKQFAAICKDNLSVYNQSDDKKMMELISKLLNQST